MKTRRMFLIALCGVAMLIGTSSCKKEKQENENGEKMVIKASLGSAGNNSKTHLDGKKVIWDSGDAFKLFPTDGMAGTEFTLTRIDEHDGKVAYFEGKHPGGEHFYACYPFSNVSCNTPHTFKFEIPESQSDVTNAGPMVGYMEEPSGSLVFQNAMSWLKVGLKGNVVIKRVVLTDTDGNALNGTLTVTCSNEGGFSFETLMSGTDETANQLEIVSNNGTQLSDEYTYFWFMVPAGSLASLNLSAYLDVAGSQKVLNLNRTIENGIGQNHILTANVNSPIIEGALPGLFSVSATKQVYFSKGNLQYVKSTRTWQFAANQYDFVETTGLNVGDNYTSATAPVQTLFGWGDLTPLTTSKTADYSWTDDWGTKIDGKVTWSTLTGGASGEWNYLLKQRSMKTVSFRYTNKTDGITIGGTDYKGLFIYPDDYSGNEVGNGGPSTWDEINNAGIVFLPAAGGRDNTSVYNVGYHGYYWSSSPFGSNSANSLSFGGSNVDSGHNDSRYSGFSVRLVSVVPKSASKL